MRDPAEQLTEGRLSRDVGAQHERVHEEADEAVELRVRAVGHGRADRDVRARAEAGEQRGQCGVRHQEEAGLLVRGHLQELPVHVRGDREGHRVAGAVLRAPGRRPLRTVGG
ncbi:hypothetical protein GCM10020295_35730 [Streptomyces cinereospinus]